MQTDTYTVKTHVFEGPLEVLLDMIERRKFFINDISLASVADDYIGYIQSIEDFPTSSVASFLFVASTLVLIKSKSLLPTLELTQQEEGDIAELERRLKIYQRMKELSMYVKDRFGKEIIFPRGDSSFTEPVFSPHASITTDNLLGAIRGSIDRLPKKEHVPKAVVQRVMSLEEMVGTLVERVQSQMRINFREFAKHKKADATHKEQKLNLIVGFLAMLELVKRGAVAVQQDNNFEDIFIHPGEVVTQ